MGGSDLNPDIGGGAVPLESLPKTALQAIYHAVTGKTENLSKDIAGSVLIYSADIDRLYQMICEQLEHYELQTEPTVTITIKCENNKTVTYSSWGRYQVLRTNNHDITSEFILKIEFVIKLPGTNQPQRCVISASLDSALPIISPENRKKNEDPFSLYFFRREWRAVQISIDFVDFLVAKLFTALIEEWFKTLRPTPQPRLNGILVKNFHTISSCMGQFGRLGMAAYLTSYVIITKGNVGSMAHIILSVALGLFIWGAFVICETIFTEKLLKRIMGNVIPTVILLTDKDTTTYDDVVRLSKSTYGTVFRIFLVAFGSILINILSSYLYAWLTKLM